MTRFCVHHLRSGDGLVLDVQANILADLPSRVVAPVIPSGDMSWSITRLNPRLAVLGKPHVLALHRLAAIPTNELGAMVDDLSGQADTIAAALDFLFQGF